MTRRRPGILHLPWNIAGNPLGLSRGERRLGFRSDVAVLEEHAFGYEADFNLDLGWRFDNAARAKKAAFLAKAIARYDVFHYTYGGHTFFRELHEGVLRTEVPILKRFGKTILATFCGDDARPPSGMPFVDWDQAYLDSQALNQPKRRSLMLNYADRVFYLNPDLRQWLPGAQFRAYSSVDPRVIEAVPPPDGEELVVGHAPSDRVIKGTAYVVAAVDSLRAEGLPIRLELIENVSHSEVLARLARADVVVDQLNMGWYGAFAVEAMATGRPVLCYIDETRQGDNPFGSELPIVRTTKDTVADDLRALVGDRQRLVELGQRSRAFVERHHDPVEIARQNLAGLIPIPGDL